MSELNRETPQASSNHPPVQPRPLSTLDPTGQPQANTATSTI